MSLLSGISKVAGGLGGFIAGSRANKATPEQKQSAEMAKLQGQIGKQIMDTYGPMGQQVNTALMNPQSDPWFQSLVDWQSGLINSDVLEKLNAAQIAQNRAQAVGAPGWATNPERRDEAFLRALASAEMNTHPQATNNAVQYASGLLGNQNTAASTLSSASGPIGAGSQGLANFGNLQQRNNQQQAGAFGDLINSGVNLFGDVYDHWQKRQNPQSDNPAAVTQQGNF